MNNENTEQQPQEQKRVNNQNDPQQININITTTPLVTDTTQLFIGPHVVNKLIYCLLAFFIGGLGAHKFYAGRNAAGVLYLLFFWTFIPSIIAFIEFIIALLKPADINGKIVC